MANESEADSMPYEAAAEGDVDDEEEDHEEPNRGDIHEEEDHEGEIDDFGELPPIMSQHSPLRMALSPRHHELALAYKRAAREVPELDELPDFWYAQLAVVCEGDRTLGDGLDRLMKLQQFRQEYGITNSLADGRKCMKEYLDLFPGYLMSCDFMNSKGAYTLVLDLCQFDAQALKRDPLVFLKGSYYLEQIGSCDLEAIRKGVIVLLECDGYNWTEHMGIKVLDQIWTELWGVYPMNIYQLKHFHTGLFVNMVGSISKRFVPANMRRKFQFGCKSEGGRLDTLFNQPSLEVARERLWSRLEHCLTKRYENERTFTLNEP